MGNVLYMCKRQTNDLNEIYQDENAVYDQVIVYDTTTHWQRVDTNNPDQFDIASAENPNHQFNEENIQLTDDQCTMNKQETVKYIPTSSRELQPDDFPPEMLSSDNEGESGEENEPYYEEDIVSNDTIKSSQNMPPSNVKIVNNGYHKSGLLVHSS